LRQINCYKMYISIFYRLAVEALLEEAKLGARRAEIMGPSGWIKPKETVNKRFLHSTLRNAMISNEHQSLKQDKVKIQSHKTDINDRLKTDVKK